MRHPVRNTLLALLALVLLALTWQAFGISQVPTPETPEPAEEASQPLTPPATVTSPPEPVALTPEPTIALPSSLNLAVPFTSQAPHGNWDAAHEEYCEEASLLMAARYFRGQTIAGPDDTEAELARIAAWQESTFGYFESTTAEETARIGRELLDLDVTVSLNVEAETIRRHLNDGALVIIPAAGRRLGNPYFRAPGPIYHMLVVKGYTETGAFITNDPGTRRGAEFMYPADALLAAIHDYNGGNVEEGRRVILVVRPNR
ncbi:MAG: C39 family peptidase [Patescibacteria group bacterium]|jgi:hypothetical protein